VEDVGNVYVTGRSESTWGTPVNAHSGSGYDAFVARLDGSGNRIWNTFMGSEDDDSGNWIAVDGVGNVYVTGYSYSTWGTPVTAHNGGYDAFVARLDGSGNRIWNTFMGSEDSDSGNGLAVDGVGNVYVTGDSYLTWGTPVNAHNGSGYDVFVARLDSSGNRIWNTFMGSEDDDYGYGIAVENVGDVYVTGRSESTWGIPVNAHNGGADAFVARFDSSGNRIWNTFMGSEDDDYGNEIAADGVGNVYVTGTSYAPWGTPVNAHNGGTDAFAAKLSATVTNLAVNKIGSGTGKVTSNPEGIDCGGDCLEWYLPGEIVTLSATPDSGMVFGGWVASGCGATGDCTVAINSDPVAVYAIFNDPTIDRDLDSVSDQNEQGPYSDDPDYDGNADGIADWLQPDVISCFSFDGGLYTTTRFVAPGLIMGVVVPVDKPATDPPASVEFTHGFYLIAINSMFAGFNATVTMYFEDGDPPDTYYKYGPTPSDPTYHWYEFLYDGETGAEINGNVITLHFVNGKRGDDDLDNVNGIITDIGGPATISSSSAGGGGGGGGGGGSGCLIYSAAYEFRMPKELLALVLLLGCLLIGLPEFRKNIKKK
jgi:hypothetical protein